ncbi:hypothetical protein GGF42_009558, partial [Coemansia sp. RSA 2424]
MNPPVGALPVAASDGDPGDEMRESASDRAYSVSVSVRKGPNMVRDGEAGLRVNGHVVEATPFSLDPTISAIKPHSSRPSSVPPSSASNPRLTPNVDRSDTPASAVAAGVTSTPLGLTPAPEAAASSDTLASERSRRGSSATTSAYVIASETPGAATDGETNIELQAVPLIRLHQASQVPASQWKLVGTAASGGIT